MRLIGSILFNLLLALITNDALKRVPSVCEKIIELAARLYPKGESRKRYRREYLGELDMKIANESELAQLSYSLQTLFASARNNVERVPLNKALVESGVLAIYVGGFAATIGFVWLGFGLAIAGTGLALVAFYRCLLNWRIQIRKELAEGNARGAKGCKRMMISFILLMIGFPTYIASVLLLKFSLPDSPTSSSFLIYFGLVTVSVVVTYAASRVQKSARTLLKT